MAINLKNYTTEVAATKSIEMIEKLLVDFGAFNIMKEYTEMKPLVGRRCSSISFIIEVDGMRLPFKLPTKVEQTAKWLRKQKPNSTDKTILEQSERIAWKQQYEILHLQLGQIIMGQLEKLEALFPYLLSTAENKTYYQKLKEGNFKALLLNN